MFGQKTTMGFGSGFGTGASSTFGSTTPFGQNNNTFGSKPAGTTGFGTPAFGSSTPSTGGLFGTNNNTNAGGLFGQANANSTFGNTSTGFNFGGTPSTSTGGGGLFGQTQTQPAGGLFSTPQSTTSAFGTKTPGFGGFGTTTSTSSGLFGQQNQSATGGMLFGQGTGGFAGSTSGTTVKFNPPAGQDTMMKNGTSQNINTRHQCITAMKEYDNKSLEELRVEDYQANRKGKQAGTSGGLFGSTPATSSAPGGFSFGGFGTNTSTASGGLFGQPSTQASGGLFGQSKPLFGGTSTAPTSSTGFSFGSTPQSTGGLFGQQPNKPLFGTAASQPLFGTNTSNTPAATSFSFGNNTGFGTQNQAGGLFGSKPTGFGTATTASTGFFGGTGGGLFPKATTASSFNFGTNTSTAGFGGFGSTATPAAGGLFGNKPTGFGTNTSTLGGGTTFNFGNTGQTTGGLFGSTQNKPTTFGFNFNTGAAAPTGFGTGLGTGTGTNFSLGGNTATLGTTTNPAVNNQLPQQLLALASSPFGDSPLFWNLKQNSEKREETLKPTNPTAQKAALSSSSQYKVSPRPTAKIKPKSLHSLMNGSKSQLFDGLEDEDFSFGNDTFMPRRSVKKLTLKKVNGDTPDMSRASSQTDEHPDLHSFNAQDTPRARPITRTLQDDLDNAAKSPDTEPIIRTKSITEPVDQTSTKDSQNLDDTIAALNSKKKGLSNDTSSEMNKSQDVTSNDVSIEPQAQTEDFVPHPTGIVLTRPGYYTNPPLDGLLELMDDNGDCFVDDFTIGRENYGSLFFPGTTNVANLNLDEIVHFRRKEVIVYPDDEKKPPLGEGLNKMAEVTLDCVWPNDKTSRSPIKDTGRLRSMHYQDKIEDITAKIGAKFIDYRPETGSWVFQVKHFSKYGLLDDSDEEEVSESEKKKLKVAQQQQLQIQVSSRREQRMEREWCVIGQLPTNENQPS